MLSVQKGQVGILVLTGGIHEDEAVMSFEVGLTAFRQNNFEQAIASLLEYCQECDIAGTVTSQKYMQAHMGIVKSYQQLEQWDQAIAHCRGLQDTKNHALTIWLDRTLPKLEAAAEKAKAGPVAEAMADKAETQVDQASQENDMLLHQGLQAYKNMQRDRAVKLLEEYCQACNRPSSRNYMNAQMTLVKTYRELKAFETAIARCQSLSTSDNFALKSWASKMLPKLQEEFAASNPSGTSVETTNPAITNPEVTHPATTHPATTLVGAGTKTTSPVASPKRNAPIPANTKPASTSSFTFDATPQGVGKGASTGGSDGGGSVSRSRSASSAGEIPDSIAGGLIAAPKQTQPRITSPSQPSSSGRQTVSRSKGSSRSQTAGGGKAALVGGGLMAVLGQFFLKRMLRAGLGFIVFVVVVVARSCFNIGSDMTPLQNAVVEGDVAAVEQLLNKGTSTETSDDNGNTVLFWTLNADDCTEDLAYCAMSTDQQAIAQLLLAKGASVTVANTWQETPLHWAAGLNGSADIVKTMVSQGANVNARDMTQATPLHWAASAGAIDNIELLISSGADVNAKDADGYTPLDYAGSDEVAQLLKSRQAVSGL